MVIARRNLFVVLVGLAICASSASGQGAHLLIITNRTLIDNQFIFGSNQASPPTLSKRVIDLTHRGVYGLSPADSVIKASTSIQGGIMTGNPNLTFTAADQTIARAAGSWISDGFAVGQYIFVKKTGSNNNIPRAFLTAVASDKLTVAGTAIVDATSSAGFTVRGGDRFVTVANFGTPEIYNGQRANTSNITIDGNQPVPIYPQSDQDEQDLSPWGATYTADGIGLDGQLATAQNVLVHHCRGIGIAHQQGDGRVFDSEIHHCHTGIRVPSSDMEVRRCRIFNCRDACLFLARDSGNTQSTDNHCYAARIACYNEGAFPHRATGDTYADSWIGYFGSVYAIRTVLTNVLFQHNTTRDCVFRNYGCSLEGCVIDVMRDVTTYNHFLSPTPLVPTYSDKKVGVELEGDNCSIRGGAIQLTDFRNEAYQTFTGNGAEAVWVSGNGCVIETQLLGYDSVDHSVGIRVKGAVKGLKVDVTTQGFHDANDLIFILDNAPNCNGLDITLRIMGIVSKPLVNYVDIGNNWKGRIRLINTTTGQTKEYIDGVEQ